MAAKLSNIMAVPDVKGPVGLIAWWQLTGDVNYRELQMAWIEAGLDEEGLPAAPRSLAALRKALSVFESRKMMIRPIPKVQGYAVVREDFHDEDPQYTNMFTVRVDNTTIAFTGEADYNIKKMTLENFKKEKEHLSVAEVSAWLVRTAKQAMAVPLRETGGIYFVPENRVDGWRKFVSVVMEISKNVIWEMPALRTDKAIDAIIGALLKDAEAERKAMEAYLREDVDLRKGALERRANTCEAMRQKLAAYEELLGTKIKSVSTIIEALDAKITEAILATDAGD